MRFPIQIISKYLIKEIAPQFLFVLVIFSSVIFISQLLRLSDVLMAFGFSLENILLPFLFIVAPFLSLMIPISYLFGTMLAFMRLSADNEYAALLSAGINLRQNLVPIFYFSAIVFFFTAFASTSLESWGKRQFEEFLFRKTKTEIDNIIRLKIQEETFADNFLGYMFYTEKVHKNFNYENVLIAPMGGNKNDFLMTAAKANVKGSMQDGFLNMVFYDGRTYSYDPISQQMSAMTFETAEVDLLRAFKEKVFGNAKLDEDFRSFSVFKLYQYVKNLEKDPEKMKEKDYLRSHYLFQSRLANPFLVFFFAVLGIILGIHDIRMQKNKSYFLAILSTMGVMISIVFFRWLAEEGHLNAIYAAWLPIFFYLMASAFLIYQKNRLPVSENILAPRNFPFLGSS